MPRIVVGKENSADIEIHYEDHGSGNPIVLIHGYPLDGNSWERQERELLANGSRVISYDRRGFGRSSQPTVGYDYDTFAADLNALLENLDLSEVVLAGFSMGSGEVTRYLGTYGSGRVRYFKDFFDNFYNADELSPERISDQARQASFDVAASASPHASLACVDAWLTDFRDDLPKVDVPHNIGWTHPDEVNAALLEFVSG
jgi:non-heme chloroperoxidase